jgi:hypothetical protein
MKSGTGGQVLGAAGRRARSCAKTRTEMLDDQSASKNLTSAAESYSSGPS